MTVLEHMPSPGRKLLITGKGRCNLTNACDEQEFLKHVRRNPRFLYSALAACPPAQVMALFEDEMGVPLKVERGRRVFPQSDSSRDILAALLRFAGGARIVYDGAQALLFRQEGGGKRICGVRGQSGREYRAGAVVVATGGVSYQATGLHRRRATVLPKRQGTPWCRPSQALWRWWRRAMWQSACRALP